MNHALWRIGWRYLWRHPWQAVLMLVGIALGVAMVVSIDLANSAASRAFDLSTEAIAGRATHQIVGGSTGLDESLYTRLRVQGGVTDAAPVVTDYFTSPQLGGRPMQLLGVDPFAEAPFRSYLSAGAAYGPETGNNQLITFFTRPGALIMSEGLAGEYGLRVGDAIRLHINGQQKSGVLVALLRPTDRLSARALDGLVLADISTAQELAGQVGRLDHIDLILPADNGAAEQRIAALLPPGVQIVTVGARSGAVAQMTAAFRLNLTALSLLALVVGMFLIYNTMTFSVVQRRALFGALRCLGVTQGEVGRLVLVEAVGAGALGSALGLGLGVLLGQGAVRLVTQTINDLYFVVTVRGLAVSGSSLAKGAAVGMLATVAAAALPAREAALVPPQLALRRSDIEERAGRLVPVSAAAGGLLLLAGVGLLAIPTRSLIVSFGGLFAVVLGFALTAPLVTRLLLRAATPATSRVFGVLGRMAPRSVVGALSRTAVAVAALMVAISVVIGVGLMVGSFRTTVIDWLGQTLYSDVYIAVPEVTGTHPTAPLDPAVIKIAAGWPGVRSYELQRSVTVASPAGQVAVSGVSTAASAAHRTFISTDTGGQSVEAALAGGAVLASEPLANRLNLPRHGAAITLDTDRGPHTFPVAGIYRDYSSSQGVAIMTLEVYRHYWNDNALSAMSLTLQPGVNPDTVAHNLGARLAQVQEVSVQSNRSLRNDVLRVFDQAFAITNALQLLAALVAFVGVLSALLSLQLERAHELGVLRAIGLTVRQLSSVVFIETGLIGAVAGLLSMPTGLALALILTFVINRRSFGWTLQFQLNGALFAQALALSVVAALLAGIYPALRLGRMLAAEVLRGE
jgi:putative ABC transport system permease protein